MQNRGSGSGNGGNRTYIDDVSFVAVPEPATWGMMLAGFGLIGASMRRRSMAAKAA